MRTVSCFLCKQDVLGLSGQDGVMDTVWLGAGSVDSLRISFSKAFGPCHLRCLADSRWGRPWARAYAIHESQVVGWPVFYSDGVYVLLRRQRLHETRLVSQQGWMATVTDAALHQAIAVDNGYLTPVSHALDLDLSDKPRLLQSAQTALDGGGTYPLLSLVQELGVESRLIYPMAVQAGVLRSPASDSSASSRSAASAATRLRAVAEYHCFVPQQIGDTMLANIPPPLPLAPDVDALLQAVKANNLDQVGALLDRGIDVNGRDEQQWTALMWAATLDNVELTRLLLARGADVQAQDVGGDTALAFASAGGDPQIAQMLRAAGGQ